LDAIKVGAGVFKTLELWMPGAGGLCLHTIVLEESTDFHG
jgi:hypothetical protein